MSRWLLTTYALSVCLPACAQITVEENRTRARLVHDVTTVVLGIQNSDASSRDGRVELDWLLPEGDVARHAELSAKFPPGPSTWSVPLPLTLTSDALFYRLRYRVAPAGPEGFLSFPQIADHAFVLNSTVLDRPRAGRPFEIRVSAVHPISRQPVPGVTISAEDGTERKTGANGVAVLTIKPAGEDWKDKEQITLEAHLGDFKQWADSPEIAFQPPDLRIQTDKPLYQPGQTLHVRLLAFGGDGQAHAGVEYSLKITDGRQAVVYTAELKTSRFGIAACDWEIPPGAAAGLYGMEVSDDNGALASRAVQIRRYELPSFRVTVEPDRPFYLPGQNATVEVRADYLFGKPVTAGTARITEADSDQALQQGPLDAAGRFQAGIDLSDAPVSGRYVDLHYTAYLTDAGTNRTEQRNFDLRVSRDAIHVYVLPVASSTVPQSMFVNVNTPDGKPAQSDVEVLLDGRQLGVARTNRMGIARLELALPAQTILVRARTAGGAAAETEYHVQGAEKHLSLRTDHALYRPGQWIRCEITSDRADLPLTLLAWHEGAVLYSRRLQLRQGRAHVVIPYAPAFGRELSLGVLSIGGAYQAARTVVYPGNDPLRVSVRPARATYKPGEQALLALQADSLQGESAQAAFGVAVVDQGVFERAEADRALGRVGWFDYGSEGGETSIGGMTRAGLLRIDPQDIDDDLQITAEALLADTPLYDESADFLDKQSAIFRQAVGRSLDGVQRFFDQDVRHIAAFPRDETALRRMGFTLGLDPWGQPYRAAFSIQGPRYVLELQSAGPDKRSHTADDFVALKLEREWFSRKTLIGAALDKLIDYPATPEEFMRWLENAGFTPGALIDPWGNRLQPRTTYTGAYRIISLWSAGPDRNFGTPDDFMVAQWTGRYFQSRAQGIDKILDQVPALPDTEAGIRATLAAAGFTLDNDRDPWGRPYYIRLRTETRIAGAMEIYSYAEYQRAQQIMIKPVSRTYMLVDIDSAGPDGQRGTHDDFTLASYSRAIAAEPPRPHRVPPLITGGEPGMVIGFVVDLTGAVIPNVAILVDNQVRTRTGDDGSYSLRDLPPGDYTLRFQAPGFQTTVIAKVPVRSEHVTRVDAKLDVSAVSEMVEVTAPLPLQTNFSAAMVAEAQVATSTPRVRDYFPETLLWSPEVIAGKNGRAVLKFKLADSITTWHVAVIASTPDGRVTEAGTEVRAFQPFFADLDPPPVLTAGDEIALPVPVRNYLPSAARVNVAVSAPPSLAVLDAPRDALRIASSSSANVLLRMRASAAPADARLRLTARTAAAADAVEKAVSIHPDGEPVSRSSSGILASGESIHLPVPAEVIPGSLQAEVKLYPSLLAHIIESMEGILRKPTGCGEQTISSAYPNLLFLQALKQNGLREPRLEPRAGHNLASGYRRLLGYRTPEGAFAYWHDSRADLALTAYAIQFLEEAKDFVEIDEDVIATARTWLRAQNPEETTLRSFAWSMDRLEPQAAEATGWTDPYALAAFAMSAMDANRTELARSAIARLRELARTENRASAWRASRPTPYHGWGRAGDLENTAMAVTALARWRKLAGSDSQLDALIDRAVLFLLRNQDEFGSWLTTQATVRVFQALLAALASNAAARLPAADIFVNGTLAMHAALPADNSVHGPVIVDVSRFVKPGADNVVSISSGGQAQFTANWYQPWSGARTSGDFALETRFSTTTPAVNDPVTCDVTIMRPAWSRYGMMIAEIGLPPGAEVDRASLADAKLTPGLDSAEVMPDRVVLYVWPRAEKTSFQFLFRPRYAIRARSAPSVLYDYYNPDARSILPPQLFEVQ